MKKLLFLCSICLAVSCSTDFDISGEWQDITVVYGILDQTDSNSFIKVNKAFLGEGDILQMAQIEDSSTYYNDLDVKVEEFSGNNYIKTIAFDTTTIYNKDSGTFYYPRQIVYKAPTLGLLNEENTYKLKITNSVTGKEITAQTTLVKRITSLEKPKTTILNFTSEVPAAVEWKSAVRGRKHQLVIRFNYKEVPLAGGTDTVFKFVDWVFPAMNAGTLNGGELMSLSYSNQYLYDLLQNRIPVNPTVKRIPGKKGYSTKDIKVIEFILSIASEEFSTYLDVNAPSTSVVQEKPDYTNIVNGIGLFASRYHYERGFKMNDLSLEKLTTIDRGFIYIP